MVKEPAACSEEVIVGGDGEGVYGLPRLILPQHWATAPLHQTQWGSYRPALSGSQLVIQGQTEGVPLDTSLWEPPLLTCDGRMCPPV